MTKIWSTADVHPRDRVAYWVDGLSGAIAHVDCDPRRDEPFFAEQARFGVRPIRRWARLLRVRRVGSHRRR